MLATSGGFASAVAGTEYYGAWQIQITLPGGVYPDVTLAVQHVALDGQTVSDQPDGTRLQVGYPSLGAEFTLSGLVDQTDETKTAAWLFGRYSTTSPLYHQDALYAAVTVDLGLYTDTAGGTPEYVRKFTGVVDDYTVGADGTVTFTCIDKIRAALRSVPALPPVVTAPPWNAGLTSEFAVDYLLRTATNGAVSSWPARRGNCQLAVGLRASLWPEVGTLNTDVTFGSPSFADGPYGTGLATFSSSTVHYVSYTPAANIGTDVYLEFLISGLSTGGSAIFTLNNVALTDQMSVTVYPDRIEVSYQRSGSGASTWTWTTATDSTAHLIGVAFHMATGSTSWNATASKDAASSSSGTMTSGGARAASFDTVFVAVNAPVVVAGVQVTTQSSASSSYPFTPGAVLNPSLNSLDVVPEIAEGDPFQAIQQIADAELAVAGGDESGIFRFYNRSSIRGASTARTLTSSASLVDIGGVETTAAAVVNHATVEYTGWNFASARTTAWAVGKARKVPKGGTLTLVATTDSLFANVDTTMSNLAAGSSDVANSHYRASIDKAGTAEFGGTLTFSVTQTGSQQLTVVVTNPSGQDAWLVSPANYVDIPVGTPLLRIAALAVTAADTLTADYSYPVPPSSSRFGEQVQQISGNPWIQDDTTAATLAYDIVQDMYLPKPNLTGVEIVPDPRIQLIDVLHLQDTDRTLVDEFVRVFGWHIQWEADDQGSTYSMTLDARTVALPGGWIGGVAGRSEGDTTTFGY